MSACRPRSDARLRVPRRSRGVTLIELVVTITILSFAVTGVVGALSANAIQSADRMIRQQATAIANAYVEEILLKAFTDPNVNGETARATFDDVSDYNGLSDVGAHDQLGNALVNLGDYNVTVRVGAGSLGGLPAAAVKLVDVTVTHAPTGTTVSSSGYRTAHPFP